MIAFPEFPDILAQTISGLIVNLPWFILFYIGFKMIAKEIKEAVKHIPNWIEAYEVSRLKVLGIDLARRSMK